MDGNLNTGKKGNFKAALSEDRIGAHLGAVCAKAGKRCLPSEAKRLPSRRSNRVAGQGDIVKSWTADHPQVLSSSLWPLLSRPKLADYLENAGASLEEEEAVALPRQLLLLRTGRQAHGVSEIHPRNVLVAQLLGVPDIMRRPQRGPTGCGIHREPGQGLNPPVTLQDLCHGCGVNTASMDMQPFRGYLWFIVVFIQPRLGK